MQLWMQAWEGLLNDALHEPLNMWTLTMLRMKQQALQMHLVDLSDVAWNVHQILDQVVMDMMHLLWPL